MTGYKWKQPVSIEGNSVIGTLISDSKFVQKLSLEDILYFKSIP